MLTVYYVHYSLGKNGDFRYNIVTQSFPKEPNMTRLSIKDYGSSFAERWPPDFTVEPISKRGKTSDLLRVNPFLVVSEKAHVALKDILQENGEFLNVQCAKIPGLVACNVTRLLDVLNKDTCDFWFLDEGDQKRSIRVFKYDFIEERITAPIFRIKEDPGLFVTDGFVELVRRSGLKGFGFRRLWNSKEGRVHSTISGIGEGLLPEDEDYNW